ncbi:MAG TPA: hypothetical protein VFP37_05455 [Steroidobacteraceae bacterium]|nr:hypothetical protein [Steroidobacteraceae bacterium]
MDSVLEPGPSILESHPHLFSDTPVFLQVSDVDAMRRVVASIESIARLPGYRRSVLSRVSPVAQIDPRTAGVFMGFDFHITPGGPKLIEINTNAGGAFLNIAAHGAHRACCRNADGNWCLPADLAQGDAQIISMFEREWKSARGDSPLRSIAIVDENPRAQYLYPEFQLAKRLFESRGIRSRIADPAELRIAGGRLECGGEPVDLVYNRLTDFYFESPASHALKMAYERDLAVITPHPRAHALYANKRNLVLLGDASALDALGADESSIELLAGAIPVTREVAADDEQWWLNRKDWFFKPRNGFGSRGAYRGDKLTRRVFADVLRGGYLAQRLTPPSERQRSIDGSKEVFKIDVRCYAYAGSIQFLAARLYQGQTTNFRTSGGGFAPIYVVGK